MGVVMPPNTTLKQKINKNLVVGPSIYLFFSIFAPPNNKIQDKRQNKKIFV
jgi:hypothetical protein